VRTICLTLALALVMMVISSPGYGSSVDVEIKLKKDGTSCDIELKDKRFKGVCKNAEDDTKCDGTDISWEVKDNCGELAGWTLVISNAPGHPACFPQDQNLLPGIVAQFTDSDTGPKSSGSPLDACTKDKYGTYWPYEISLYGPSGFVTNIDPGGIIFP
jgi:hypothetical protein